MTFTFTCQATCREEIALAHVPRRGLHRWDEKAGRRRDAIRSLRSTCSRHKEKETGLLIPSEKRGLIGKWLFESGAGIVALKNGGHARCAGRSKLLVPKKRSGSWLPQVV
jgi:hypothetical protein